jgi:hypothetical protein
VFFKNRKGLWISRFVESTFGVLDGVAVDDSVVVEVEFDGGIEVGEGGRVRGLMLFLFPHGILF